MKTVFKITLGLSIASVGCRPASSENSKDKGVLAPWSIEVSTLGPDDIQSSVEKIYAPFGYTVLAEKRSRMATGLDKYKVMVTRDNASIRCLVDEDFDKKPTDKEPWTPLGDMQRILNQVQVSQLEAEFSFARTKLAEAKSDTEKMIKESPDGKIKQDLESHLSELNSFVIPRLEGVEADKFTPFRLKECQGFVDGVPSKENDDYLALGSKYAWHPNFRSFFVTTFIVDKN